MLLLLFRGTHAPYVALPTRGSLSGRRKVTQPSRVRLQSSIRANVQKSKR